jgi:hypothetical protein
VEPIDYQFVFLAYYYFLNFMENQDKKVAPKNGNHHRHKHHGSHHDGHHNNHDCCGGDKCCERGREKESCCCASCCSGHKVAKFFLVLVAIIGLLIIGFCWGARMNYEQTAGFGRGWMMDSRADGRWLNKDARSCGCQNAVLRVGQEEVAPTDVAAPKIPVDSSQPAE